MDEATFISLSEKYNMIPVYGTSLPDLDTPVSVFLKTRANKRPYSFLLESVAGGENRARYSILGLDFHCMVSGKNGRYTRTMNGGEKKNLTSQRPVEAVKESMQGFVHYPEERLSGFYSGSVGFFAYDIIHYYEKIQGMEKEDPLGADDLGFVIPSEVILFDHVLGEIKIIENVYIRDKGSASALYRQAGEKINAILSSLRSDAGIQEFESENNRHPSENRKPEWESPVSDEEFFSWVDKSRQYITDGDIFQVVLSRRFSTEFLHDPFYLYRFLRSTNPSPYMYFLNYGKNVVIGSSPEILVKVQNRKVTLRPIAGTIQRGQNNAEDEMYAAKLLADEKERAEHTMLVDLGRNDVGRISQFGSVRVEDFMRIEKYSHVMHIVSSVTGELREDLDAFDAFLAAFPAGTVTGAPKIRAMQIISELEPFPRGIYSGGVGYFSFNGDMDTAIILRTMVLKDRRLYIQAGAGVVYDSSPSGERDEIAKKGRALFSAFEKFLERDKYDIYSG